MTGVINLGNEHRYPPNKAVYVVESRTASGGRDARLACGIMPDQEIIKTWGLPGRESNCPRWED